MTAEGSKKSIPGMKTMELRMKLLDELTREEIEQRIKALDPLCQWDYIGTGFAHFCRRQFARLIRAASRYPG